MMNFTRRTLLSLAGAAALAALVAGCTRPTPVKEAFVLEPPSPPPVARTQAASLRMGTFTVAAPFRGRSFVVRQTDLQFETDYYHEFLVAPNSNIAEATARALAAAKVFASVTPAGVVSDADWALEAFVDGLYGDARDAGKPAAVIAITYYLRSNENDFGVPVWSRRYERRLPFTAGSASSYAAALNTGFGEILADLAKDLSAVSLPKR
ncbi:MAG: ABC-type transport auxiliary lipoprotein family protein [Burkholderiales bacterium]